MKLATIGGVAGMAYPACSALAAWTGPSDRMPDYPRFDLGPRTGAGYAMEGLCLCCLLLFVFALPGLARAAASERGEKGTALLPAVLMAAWGLIRFGFAFAGPYFELTLVAVSAFLLCAALVATFRAATMAHALLGYGSLLSALLLLGTGVTALFPLTVSDARLLGHGLLYSDPELLNPGGPLYMVGLVAWSLWVAGAGCAMLKRRSPAGS